MRGKDLICFSPLHSRTLTHNVVVSTYKLVSNFCSTGFVFTKETSMENYGEKNQRNVPWTHLIIYYA